MPIRALRRTMLLAALGLTTCSNPSPQKPVRQARQRPTAPPARKARRPPPKPAGAVATLARLNDICAKTRSAASCDLVERGWANPSGKVHGGVFDDIKQAKAELKKLGKVLAWDDRAWRYRFVAAKPPPPRSLWIKKRADLVARSGSLGVVFGTYRAIPMPTKRKLPTTTTARPNTYGCVTLDDATVVYLGVYNTPPATRSKAERRRFHGKRVVVWGYVHRRPPWGRQAPSAPCITGPIHIFDASP